MMATTEKEPELTGGPGVETRGTANLTTVDSGSFRVGACRAEAPEVRRRMTRGVFRSRMLAMNASRVAAWMFGAAVLGAWLASAASDQRAAGSLRTAPPAAASPIDHLATDVEAQAERLRQRLDTAPAPQAPLRNPFAFAPRVQPVARPGARRGRERPSPAARRTRRAVAGTDWNRGEAGRGSRRSDRDDIERLPAIFIMVTVGQRILGLLRRRGHRPRRHRVEARRSTGAIRRLRLR